MAQPLDRINQSDIIFPHLSNTPSFSSTLSSLKRSALSITNRLTSITKDSEFVARVAAAYDLPLVANERCGSWYIPLQLKTESVYFKSTDGHMGEWAFSLRRLNLQLLDVVSRHGGCVVVDSTRRGKSMPDALSKTVPFWCCVINRAVFGGGGKGEEMQLFTPPNAVSESEHAQMERRVDGFVQQFLVREFSLPSIGESTWLTVARIYANPTFPPSGPACKSHCARYGSHKAPPSLRLPQLFPPSTPSSSAPHRAVSRAPRRRKADTSKARPTTTKPGLTASRPPCSGATRTPC